MGLTSNVYSRTGSDGLAELTDWRAWLFTYVLFSLCGHFILDASYGFALYLVNGGLLLSAAIMLLERGAGRLHLFLCPALFFDAVVKIFIAGEPPPTALVASATLVFQAWAGAWLLHLNAPWAKTPDTLSKIVNFLLYGAAIPSLLSTGILVLFLASTDNTPDIIPNNWMFWIWWWIRRMTSLVLVAPLVLLVLDSWRNVGLPAFIKNLDYEFVATLLTISTAAGFVFAAENQGGRDLPPYSYLLIPLMLYIAIRLSLIKSLITVLLVTYVVYWVDSSSFVNFSHAKDSMLTLSVFLVINAIIVWMLGALIHEKRTAYAELSRKNAMNRMRSRVSQLLVKDGADRNDLFTQVCQIIEDEKICHRAKLEEIPASTQYTDTMAETLPALTRPLLYSHVENSKASESRRKVLYVGEFVIPENGKSLLKLVLVSEAESVFSAELVFVVQEMIAEISFALGIYETRDRLKLTSEVFQHSREAIMITNRQGAIIDVNQSFTRITGYERAEAIGRNPRMLSSGHHGRKYYKELFDDIAANGFWSGQVWNRRKSGEVFPLRGTISAVLDSRGEPQHLISIMEDVSERVAYEDKIEKLVNYDPLTSLPNRLYLKIQFDDRVNVADTSDKWSLVFVDLDGFKNVNDALGHRVGDELLKQVAGRMRECVRGEDVLARFGGDEFILLLHGGRHTAEVLSARLLVAITRPYRVFAQDIQIGLSLGIAVMHDDGSSLDALIQAADTAMYSAKSDGGGVYRFYSETMREDVRFKLSLRGELRKATENNELFLLYQPKVFITEGCCEVAGFEALVRWNHPVNGLVSPGVFIPAAEESGQILEVDQWVIRQVVGQLQSWNEEFPGRVLPVSINVSATLFSRPDFVKELEALVRQANIQPEWIEFEVTEHVAMQNYQHTLRTLIELREMGIGLSIDDFGTGHSNLAYLREFPIDALKIDIAFIKDVDSDEKKQGIVRAIIAMANTLGLKVIAEGVETESERQFLQREGCSLCQGFLFYKPLFVAEAGKLLHHKS